MIGTHFMELTVNCRTLSSALSIRSSEEGEKDNIMMPGILTNAIDQTYRTDLRALKTKGQKLSENLKKNVYNHV